MGVHSIPVLLPSSTCITVTVPQSCSRPLDGSWDGGGCSAGQRGPSPLWARGSSGAFYHFLMPFGPFSDSSYASPAAGPRLRRGR